MDKLIASFSFFSPSCDDDGVDQLHYYLTANLLLGLTALTGLKALQGAPVKCMSPDNFRTQWMNYVDNYCWAQGTYFISDKQREPPTPKQLDASGKGRINYYQWVPFFLIFESVCFCLPRLFWNFSSKGSGIRVADIVDLARDKTNFRPQTRDNTLKVLTSHLENALKFHRRIERKRLMIHKYAIYKNLQYTACYVTTVYLITKILFFLNALLQFKLMNFFLTGNSGTTTLTTILNHTQWEDSGLFPRVTFCIVTTRSMVSRVQNHTIQCVLMINMFNEKIFVFLWFWYLVLLFLTGASILYWSTVLLLPWMSRNYIIRHLKLADKPFSVREHAKHVHRFVSKYLQHDGLFVLRMVSLHTGVIFATDLVLCLWNNYFGYELSLGTTNSAEKALDTDNVDSKVISNLTFFKKPPEDGEKDPKDEDLDDGLIDIEALDQPLNKLTSAPQSKAKPLSAGASSSGNTTEEEAEAEMEGEQKKKEDNRRQSDYQQQKASRAPPKPPKPTMYRR